MLPPAPQASNQTHDNYRYLLLTGILLQQFLFMSFTTIFIIGGVVLLAILFLIARLAVRWAVRAAIVGIIVIALVGGGVFWWWTTRLAPKPPPKQRSAPTRRTPSN
jgi:hypothetical protein